MLQHLSLQLYAHQHPQRLCLTYSINEMIDLTIRVAYSSSMVNVELDNYDFSIRLVGECHKKVPSIINSLRLWGFGKPRLQWEHNFFVFLLLVFEFGIAIKSWILATKNTQICSIHGRGVPVWSEREFTKWLRFCASFHMSFSASSWSSGWCLSLSHLIQWKT